MPECVISAPSVNAFENRLDKLCSNHPLKYYPDMDIQFNPYIQLILDIDTQFNPNKSNNIKHSGAEFDFRPVYSGSGPHDPLVSSPVCKNVIVITGFTCVVEEISYIRKKIVNFTVG